MDMIHISPLITIFAILGILYYKKYPEFSTDKKKFMALTIAAVLAYLLPSAVYRFDTFHFGTLNLILIFLALPFIIKHKRIIPILVGTYAFQFYYYFLYYQPLWHFPYIVFLVPLLIFIISLIYVFKHKIFKEKNI